jgi:hypothetical protein
MVIDIIFHIPLKFQINPRSYVSNIALQSCCDKNLHCEDIKTIFEVKQIHYQDLHKKVWYVIMYLIPYKILYEIYTYVKPMYNIKFCIIFKTYIHM